MGKNYLGPNFVNPKLTWLMHLFLCGENVLSPFLCDEYDLLECGFLNGGAMKSLGVVSSHLYSVSDRHWSGAPSSTI